MGLGASISLTQEQIELVQKLLHQHLSGVQTLLYGSRSNGRATRTSDLDLVVFASQDQWRRVGDLVEAFEESSLPFRVDLHIWSQLSEAHKSEIERHHVEIQHGE